MKIILGSSSKYRQQILREMGYDFEIIAPKINEKAIRFDNPIVLAQQLAFAKADAVKKTLFEPSLLISSDQIVMCNGKIREKPVSEYEVREFYRNYAKYKSQTITAVLVTNSMTGKQVVGVDIATIFLRPVPPEVIDTLIRKGEIFHCAGGMQIEDPLIIPFITAIVGTRDSVKGLPKLLTERLLKEAQA